MGLCPGGTPKVRVGAHRLWGEVERCFSSLLQAPKAQLTLDCPKTHEPGWRMLKELGPCARCSKQLSKSFVKDG